MRFLRENWVWIAAPVALAVIAVAALLLLTEGGPADGLVYDVG